MRIVVHSAAIQDRDGAGLVLDKIRRRFPWLELIWADGGYNAWQVEAAVAKVPVLRMEIVKRSDNPVALRDRELTFQRGGINDQRILLSEQRLKLGAGGLVQGIPIDLVACDGKALGRGSAHRHCAVNLIRDQMPVHNGFN